MNRFIGLANLTSPFRLDGDKMFKCDLILENKADWIIHAKEILASATTVADETIEKILTFPFKFGAKSISL